MNAILCLIVVLITAAITPPAIAADKPAGAKQLRHVVSFKFKDGTTPEQIDKVIAEFRALAKKVPGTPGFEYGVNNSPEGKARGCTHCFTLTFKSEADRDTYLPHPAHKDFGKIVRQLLEEVFVIDYWAQP